MERLGFQLLENSFPCECPLFSVGFLSAAEVTPIRELDRIEIGKDDDGGRRGPITEKIQTAFDIVNGRNPKYAHWLTKV